MGAKSSRMNKHLGLKQLATLKDHVLAEIERIKNHKINERVKFTEELNATSSDEVDSANDNILKHSEIRFARRETLYLKKLQKTMTHMDCDEYGMCDECGESISFQRLSARPTSNMCITCKEESERDEKQSASGRISKSLGKQVSFGSRA